MQAAERALGKHRAWGFYRALCMRRYKRAGCIFIHIPKAAGTSVAEAVIGRRAGHFTAREVKAALGEELYSSFFSFSVTRHPVDRLVSAYRYACAGGGTQGGVRNPGLYRGGTFRTFSSFLNEWLCIQDLRQVDVLFQPQWWYLYEGEQCLVNYIGRVEDLGEVEIMVSASLSRCIHIPRKNITLDSKKADFAPTKEDVTKIREIYEEDFKRLGY